MVSLGIGAYIYQKNLALDAANSEIRAERDRANSERDRAERASDSLRLAYDSITWQNALILRQRDNLQSANDSILWQSGLILRQRNDLQVANDNFQVNLSRVLAEKANQLVDEGDSYTARLLALQALPPNRPYTIEAESALRRAIQKDDAIRRGHTRGGLSAAFSPDGKYIVSASRDKTVRIWLFPPLQELIDQTRERFKDRPLTPEERRQYYLE